MATYKILSCERFVLVNYRFYNKGSACITAYKTKSILSQTDVASGNYM